MSDKDYLMANPEGSITIEGTTTMNISVLVSQKPISFRIVMHSNGDTEIFIDGKPIEVPASFGQLSGLVQTLIESVQNS